ARMPYLPVICQMYWEHSGEFDACVPYCRAKGQSCDTNVGPCNQGLACCISLSQSGGMHYGSARVSTDDQNTALQRSALTRCLTPLRSTWLPACAGPACLGGVTRGA